MILIINKLITELPGVCKR